METNQKTHLIEIERQFDVDVETLFQAWTEAEHLKKWWHPMGDSLTEVKNDLKEGGVVAYYAGDQGLEISGTYSEVVPNEKLVYSWVWNMSDEGSESGYTLTVQFSSEGEGSKLHVTQDGFSGPELVKPHEEGWQKGLDDLAAYLSGGNNGGNAEAGQSENTEASQNEAPRSQTVTQNDLQDPAVTADRSGGYNESPEQAKVGGG
ncbi:SRPBCC family protein [Dyadobacter sandarakinus]|uniref:SRPBCC domain-containing protein n=1 Tax=Dyadobacter sandarakinus TaxID=2747268 RepID=A0ABX7I3Q5_9BACT|nr:SRPBCC domain-containing protein [Dyadobacter sandarakinus]QRR00706.1 SRPBCC domain-containing protein [Dyadobacter sandarakinus]